MVEACFRKSEALRYESVLNVRYVLIDARASLPDTLSIVNTYVAIHGQLDCHIVVLCNSLSDALLVDQLGEDAGLGLYCHGEYCTTDSDIEKLRSAATLLAPTKYKQAGLLRRLSLKVIRMGLCRAETKKIVVQAEPKIEPDNLSAS